MFKKQLSLALLLAGSSVMAEDLGLPAPFTDHMVLQQQKQVPVWGWGTAGKEVTVQFKNQQKTAEPQPNMAEVQSKPATNRQMS